MIDKTIIQVKAYEDCIVVIRWTLKDGSTFYQRVAVPPKPTREARDNAKQE